MASNLVPSEKVMLGGKEYTLRLDLNALSDFEVMTGKSILRGGLSNIADLDIADVRGLLWAMLVQDDESLSVRDVGRMIGINDVSKLTTVIGELITKVMPEVVPGEESEDDADPLAQSSSAPQSGGLDTGLPQSTTSE
jgi:hypothetical protein